MTRPWPRGSASADMSMCGEGGRESAFSSRALYQIPGPMLHVIGGIVIHFSYNITLSQLMMKKAVAHVSFTGLE